MQHLILFLVLFHTVIPVYGQTWVMKLDSVMKIVEQDQLFHGQILIAEHGEVVFHESYGVLPDENKLITNSTPLALKSITKAFTAALVLNLEQEGMIALTDKVSKYFPEWPYDGVTIKHLLSMTSGLPGFIEKIVHEGDTSRYMKNLDIVHFVSHNLVPALPPGGEYNYQNSNYIVLAALVERVTGMPFQDYMSQKILQPLDLANTYLEELTERSEAVNGNNFFTPSGDGNLYSTAEDLYRFEQAFYRNDLLSDNLVHKVFSKTYLLDGSPSNYGLGWWIIDDGAQTEQYIIGDGPNIRASIQRYPESKSTFIYIHNYSGRYWKEVYWLVRNIWFGEEYVMPEREADLVEYRIDTTTCKNYVGSYLSPAFGLLHITMENGKLYLRPNPIPGKEELIPSSDTTFYFRDKSMEWEFFLDSEGKVKGFGSKGKPESMGEKQ